MTMSVGPNAPTGAIQGTAQASAPPATRGALLLPAPAVDPMAALYGLAAQLNAAHGQQAKAEVDRSFDKKAKVEKEIAAAMERARKAQEEEKGLFDSLGIGSLVGIASAQPLLVLADMGMHMARLTPSFIESFEKEHAEEIELAAKAFCAASNGAILANGIHNNPQGYYALMALGALVVQETGALGPEASDYVGAAVLASSAGGGAGRANIMAIVADKDSATADRFRELDKETREYTKWVAIAGMAVAAAGAVVATWGTASVVIVGIGIALSASGFVVGETRCFGDASAYIGAGLGIAGGVMTGFGAAGAGSAAARVLTAGGAVVQGAAETRQGLDQVRTAATEKVADDANTDAQAHRFEAQRIERLIEKIIEEVRDTKDSFTRLARTINETIELKNQTQLIAVNALRG